MAFIYNFFFFINKVKLCPGSTSNSGGAHMQLTFNTTHSSMSATLHFSTTITDPDITD